MNLPPVPGAPLPPSVAAAGQTLPPPPPPPPPPAPSFRLSRRAGWIIGGVLALLVIVLWLAARLESPGDGAIRAYAQQASAAAGFEMQSAQIVRGESGGGVATFHVEIMARQSDQPVFVPLLVERVDARPDTARFRPQPQIPGGREAPDSVKLDLETWAQLRETAASENAAELRQMAGFSEADLALLQTTVVREVARDSSFAGALHHRPLTVRAKRRGLRWELSHESPRLVQGEDWQPRTLAEFPGRVLVANRVSDRAELAAFAAGIAGLQQRVERAAAALFEKKRTAFLASLRPGLLFAGTAEDSLDRTRQPRVFLEVTELRLDENPPRLSALVRNDGGWTETRLFSGTVGYDEGTGAIQLRLSAPRDEDFSQAGPFLSDISSFRLHTDLDGDSVLRLASVGSALVWTSSTQRLSLEPVPENQRAQLIKEIEGDHAQLVQATEPGRIYVGTVTSKAKGTRGEWVLVLGSDENEESAPEHVGRGLLRTGVLENPARPDWKLAVNLRLAVNRHRSPNGPLNLSLNQTLDDSAPAEAKDLFSERGNANAYDFTSVPLRLENGRLLGENARFTFRFEPAPAAFVAAREKAEADRLARVQAFIAEGAIHAGTVKREDVAGTGALRLQFLAPPAKSGSPATAPRRAGRSGGKTVPVAALLTSALHPRFGAFLEGNCDLNESSLRLEYRGTMRAWPSGELTSAPELEPYLAGFSSVRLDLKLDGAEAQGKLASLYGNTEATARFALDATKTAQLRQEQAAREARLRDFLRAGEVHEGHLRREGVNEPGRMRLRIVKSGNGEPQEIRAVLQSATSPKHAVALEGKFFPGRTMIAFEAKNISTDTPDEDPALAAHLKDVRFYNLEVGLIAEDEGVRAVFRGQVSDALTLHFPIDDALRVRLRQEEVAAQARFRELTTVGAVHEGVATRAGASESGPLRLRVTKAAAGSDGFEGELFAPDRPGFGLQLKGSISPDVRVLRLATGRGSYGGRRFESLEDDPAVGALFKDFPESNSFLLLAENSGAFAGEFTSSYGGRRPAVSVRFTPSSAEKSNQLKRQQASQEERFGALFRSGAVLEGTARREQRTGRIRLLILQVDATVDPEEQGRKFTALLEPVALTEPSWKIEGVLRPEFLRAELRSDGTGEAKGRPSYANNPSQTLLPPYGASDTRFNLILQPNSVAGEIRGRDPLATQVEFPLP